MIEIVVWIGVIAALLLSLSTYKLTQRSTGFQTHINETYLETEEGVWWIVCCHYCDKGYFFFTNRTPKYGEVPCKQHCINNSFEIPETGDMPCCNHCGECVSFQGGSAPLIEYCEVLRSSRTIEILNSIQDNRED